MKTTQTLEKETTAASLATGAAESEKQGEPYAELITLIGGRQAIKLSGAPEGEYITWEDSYWVSGGCHHTNPFDAVDQILPNIGELNTAYTATLCVQLKQISTRSSVLKSDETRFEKAQVEQPVNREPTYSWLSSKRVVTEEIPHDKWESRVSEHVESSSLDTEDSCLVFHDDHDVLFFWKKGKEQR